MQIFCNCTELCYHCCLIATRKLIEIHSYRGRDVNVRLGVDLSALLGMPQVGKLSSSPLPPIIDDLKPDLTLKNLCRLLCKEFLDLFGPELGCLNDFQPEVEIKCPANLLQTSCGSICHPDLYQAYDAGVTKLFIPL